MSRMRLLSPWAMMPRDFFDMPEFFEDSSSARMDMYEKDDNVIVEIEAPGYQKDQISVSLENGVLTVSGRVKQENKEEDKNKKYYRKEINTMSFTRSVELPYMVDSTKTDAQFKDGRLTITMPRKEESKPKQIEVRVD